MADHLVDQGSYTFSGIAAFNGPKEVSVRPLPNPFTNWKGGMGLVFLAEHELMGRKVAIKVLPRKKVTDQSEEAFRREIRMLGRLDHEN